MEVATDNMSDKYVVLFLLGQFPGIWILCAEISKHPVCSLFVGVVKLTPPMKMEQKQCSETSAHKLQIPGTHPKERIKNSEKGKNLKLRTNTLHLQYS
jgi:hypothetical protein